LQALLDGTLAEGDQAALTGHLDECAPCQQSLERLAGGDWLPDAVRSAPQTAPAPEAALAQAIVVLKSSGPPEETLPADEAGEELILALLDPSPAPGCLGRLGPYEVREALGRGGMGVVFKALDPRLGRFVALKVLAPRLAGSASARKRFAREARAAAAVRHENVVAVHGVDEARGLPYLVMEYVPGRSLEQVLDDKRSLPLAEVVRIGLGAARGLAAAHAQGLVHRDVKPANVLLEDETGRVRITDFGLARAVDDVSLTRSGVLTGTPRYMAPEQARGERLDHRADLFSLGSLLYVLCTGRPPFAGDSALAVMRGVCDDAPPPVRDLNPDVPPWLAGVIARLQAKAPADRFPSAGAVAEVLGQGLAHLRQPGAVPPPGGPPPRARRRLPRPRLRWLAAAVLLLAVAGGTALVAPRLRPPPVEDVVTCMQYAPDGKVLAVGSRDGSVQLLDVDTRAERLRIQAHPGPVVAMAFPPGGGLLATGGDDGIKVWDTATGQVHAAFPRGGVRSLSFGSDGTKLASVGGDGRVEVWDVPARRELLFLNVSEVDAVTFYRQILATGGADGCVRLWDVATGEETLTLAGHTNRVKAVAFSPDGKRLATAGADRKARLWDARTGVEVQTLPGEIGAIRQLMFTTDGRKVASVGSDPAVQVWDAVTGQEVQVLRHAARRGSRGATFSPDGRFVAVAQPGGTVGVWDLERGAERKVLRLRHLNVELRPEEK
jgi:hypothetical protein